MTVLHQDISLTTKRLYLPKNRLFKHFLDCFIMAGITLVVFVLIVKGWITRDGYYNSPYFLFFLIFPLFTLLIYLNKRQELRLREVHTRFSKQGNYQTVKAALKILAWHIKVDNKGYIEAYTDNFGFWTWTDQMISVLPTDNAIYFTSIGNVDTYATQAFSWGQHSRNIKQFRRTFESLVNQSRELNTAIEIR